MGEDARIPVDEVLRAESLKDSGSDRATMVENTAYESTEIRLRSIFA